VFFQRDDVDASVAKLSVIGGTVLIPAADHGLGESREWPTPPARPFGSSGRRVRTWVRTGRETGEAEPTTSSPAVGHVLHSQRTVP
jgi:hypothetical protein